MAVIQSIEENFLNISLRIGERVLDTLQTPTNYKLIDGTESILCIWGISIQWRWAEFDILIAPAGCSHALPRMVSLLAWPPQHPCILGASRLLRCFTASVVGPTASDEWCQNMKKQGLLVAWLSHLMVYCAWCIPEYEIVYKTNNQLTTTDSAQWVMHPMPVLFLHANGTRE